MSRSHYVRDHALKPFGKKPTARLNRNQLEQKLAAVCKQLKNEQLKKSDHLKCLKRARQRIKNHELFFDAISTNTIPGLYRLLHNAKTAGWSIEKTAQMALKALRGDYHVRNYPDFDKDLSSVVGPPSTLGDVKISDLMENIEMLFRDTPVGEQETDEISGLCEHATAELETLKMGSDLASVKAPVKAVRKDRVHVGKEFSVASFARHAQADYGAKPVLLMPTCKKRGWKCGAMILQKMLLAWKLSPYGVALHGDVKSIASDGDGGCRAAMYLIYNLHAEESNLPGLNLYTGAGGETMDYDPKH
ncbi:hypothetical protein C8R46DRAFT_1025909 [Mycena filopes]|nr:hypothetical protein C8R46DRAFT_1025909 [Mycena filopes]